MKLPWMIHPNLNRRMFTNISANSAYLITVPQLGTYMHQTLNWGEKWRLTVSFSRPPVKRLPRVSQVTYMEGMELCKSAGKCWNYEKSFQGKAKYLKFTRTTLSTISSFEFHIIPQRQTPGSMPFFLYKFSNKAWEKQLYTHSAPDSHSRAIIHPIFILLLPRVLLVVSLIPGTGITFLPLHAASWRLVHPCLLIDKCLGTGNW